MTAYAISWAAVSSKPQAERESLHDQHRLNHALAEALDWQIVADVTVPGESRSYHRLSEATENLEAYRTLQDLAINGNIDWLIVKSRDRLARTQRLNRQVSDFLHDHGIRVYSRAIPPANLEERGEAEVWGEAIEAGYSEAEILRLKQRREMGMQARVKAGRMPGTPPWGFKRIADERGNTRYVFSDPRAEEAVRFIIPKYHAGLSMLHLLQEVRDAGFRTATGKRFHTYSVRRIIFQPAYYGLSSWGKRRSEVRDGERHFTRIPPDEWLTAEAYWDAPFTPDDWAKTLTQWRRRCDEHPRRRGTSYPLSGILWCGHCDVPFGGTYSRPGKLWYRCSRFYESRLEKPRHQHYISLPDAHNLVGDHILEFAQNPDSLSRMHDPEPQRDRHTEKDLLLQQADEIARRRKRWMDAYDAGAIDLADFSEQINRVQTDEDKLKLRMERLEAEIASTQAREDWLTFTREVLPTIPEMLASDLSPAQCDELRSIFSKLVHHIILTDGNHLDFEWKWR